MPFLLCLCVESPRSGCRCKQLTFIFAPRNRAQRCGNCASLANTWQRTLKRKGAECQQVSECAGPTARCRGLEVEKYRMLSGATEKLMHKECDEDGGRLPVVYRAESCTGVVDVVDRRRWVAAATYVTAGPCFGLSVSFRRRIFYCHQHKNRWGCDKHIGL